MFILTLLQEAICVDSISFEAMTILIGPEREGLHQLSEQVLLVIRQLALV